MMYNRTYNLKSVPATLTRPGTWLKSDKEIQAMKSISLRGKYGDLSALVDDADYEYLNQFKWHYSTGYAYRPLPRGSRTVASMSMHREIMGNPAGMEVDHINGNKLDNRRCNLRVCTKAENRRNISKRSTNTAGYKGVCFRKDIKKWQAQITVDRKSVYLGYYDTPEEAARVYNKAAKKYYGEFARVERLTK